MIIERTFEANCTNFRVLDSLSRIYSFPNATMLFTFNINAKLILQRIMQARSIDITILLRKTKFLGTFLSPKDFLKSFTTLLKDKLLLVVEDTEAIDDYILIIPGKPSRVDGFSPSS